MPSLINRNALSYARECLDNFPVVSLQGARQVGKTTLAHELTKTGKVSFYNFDNDQTREAFLADPSFFLGNSTGETLVLDEIQRVPGLMLAIKDELEKDRRPARFLLTGSSNLLRFANKEDSLAGRAVDVRLRGLSQGERIGKLDDFVSFLVSKGSTEANLFTTNFDKESYIDALAKGGYPNLSHLSQRMKNTWIDSYVKRLLEVDVLALNRSADSARLERMVRLLAASPASELSKAKMATQANVPGGTFDNYLEVLFDLYLVESVAAYGRNLTTRQVNKPKVFLSDTAIAMRLSKSNPAKLLEPQGSDYLGGQLEAFVALELLKQRTWSGEQFELFHFRDRNGAEVDLVIELEDGSIFGIEVKASSTYKTEHFRGLKVLKEKAGSQFRGGVVLTTAKNGYNLTSDLIGLPISSLWEV